MSSRKMLCAYPKAAVLLFSLCAFAVYAAETPAWKPQQRIELVVPATPGSGSDSNAREIERFLREKRLVDANVPVVIVNKPGGGGEIALLYLNQHAGNGHYLMVTGPALLTNRITGQSSVGLQDVTPLAVIGSESVIFAVRSDSNVKAAKELAEMFRRDSSALSVALANALGNLQHLATGMVVKAVGGNVKNLKVVVFPTSGALVTALLGGHVDLIVTSASTVLPHYQSGKVRVLAVSSERRLGGAFADVPTWTELGVSAVTANVRVVVGPNGMTAGQLQYWDGILGKLTQLDEWKQGLESKLAENVYMDSKDTRRALEKQYAELRAALIDLGLAK